MFDLMQMSSHKAERRYTEAEALESAVIVVRGYIDSVTEGRSVTLQGLQISRPINTALFKIEVSEVIKGEVDGKYVYFEFVRGGMPAEFFDSVKYPGEFELYLSEVNWVPPDAIVTNSDKGLMREVDHLYMLLSEDLFYNLNFNPYAIRKPIPPIPLQDWVPRDSEGKPLRDAPAVRERRSEPGALMPLGE